MMLLAVYAWVGLTLVVVINIHWPVAGPLWECAVPWLFVITIFKSALLTVVHIRQSTDASLR